MPQGLGLGRADLHALAGNPLVPRIKRPDFDIDAGLDESGLQGREIHSKIGHDRQEHVSGNPGWTIKMQLGHVFPHNSRCIGQRE